MVTAAAILAPAGVAIFAWWFGTGAVLYADNLPPKRFRAVMAAATFILVCGLAGSWRFASDTSSLGAYLSFLSALGVWSWQEVSFYTGWVTGPRPDPCPPTARVPERFVRALGCSLYHEFSAALFGGLVLALSYGGRNQTGLATYALLWAMHESARINVLLGVPNADESFLPAHMEFLRSYMRRGPINHFFGISVTLCTALTLLLALLPGGGTGRALLAALAAVATLEHWVLALPIQLRALWAWHSKPRGPARLRFGAVESGLRPVERSRP